MLLIYLLFLGNLYDNVPFPTEIEKTRFIVGYIMGGVLVVSTLTLSLGVIGTYISDISSRRIDALLASPVKRYKITLSYFISTFVLTLVLTVAMFFLVMLYLGFSGYWFTFAEVMLILGTILLYMFISTPLILLIASFINSMNAFGAVSTIVGTLIGFLCGIYIPLAMLGDFIKSVATVLPFSHMTIHLRRILIGEDILALMPEEAIKSNSLDYLSVFGLEINIYLLLAIFLALSLLFLFFSYLRMNKKTKK
jgi:multidrug/hemolysin transport system permease protein